MSLYLITIASCFALSVIARLVCLAQNDYPRVLTIKPADDVWHLCLHGTLAGFAAYFWWTL